MFRGSRLRLAYCPRTRSASDRARCRTGYGGSCCAAVPTRRTFDPFRLLLISIAGTNGVSLNCAIFAWRSQNRVPRRSELGPNPPGADAATIPCPAFRFHPLAVLIGREGFAPVHATLRDVASNPRQHTSVSWWHRAWHKAKRMRSSVKNCTVQTDPFPPQRRPPRFIDKQPDHPAAEVGRTVRRMRAAAIRTAAATWKARPRPITDFR